MTLALARHDLQVLERVAFVGLTDFYAESICMFHQMFGGPVSYTAEFENDRPGKKDVAKSDGGQYNFAASAFEGTTADPFDQEIFEKGKEIFLANFERYHGCPVQVLRCNKTVASGATGNPSQGGNGAVLGAGPRGKARAHMPHKRENAHVQAIHVPSSSRSGAQPQPHEGHARGEAEGPGRALQRAEGPGPGRALHHSQGPGWALQSAEGPGRILGGTIGTDHDWRAWQCP